MLNEAPCKQSFSDSNAFAGVKQFRNIYTAINLCCIKMKVKHKKKNQRNKKYKKNKQKKQYSRQRHYNDFLTKIVGSTFIFGKPTDSVCR